METVGGVDANGDGDGDGAHNAKVERQLESIARAQKVYFASPNGYRHSLGTSVSYVYQRILHIAKWSQALGTSVSYVYL